MAVRTVHPLRRVHNRPPLQGHAIPVCLNLRVRPHTSDRHRQIEFHDVALPPSTANRRVPIVETQGKCIAVKPEFRGGIYSIRVSVEIAGHGLIASPSWNTQLEGEGTGGLRVNGDLNL